MKILITIDKPYAGYSIRRYLRTHFSHLSQSVIHKALRTGDIRINGQKIPLDYILSNQDSLSIWDKLTTPIEPIELSIPRQYNQLKPHLLEQTEHYWVFNKPAGLAMQGGTNVTTSLDFLLTGWMAETDKKPHLVHRLDKYTSGVCIVATNPKASYELCSLFQNRKITKKYIALCHKNASKQFTQNETGIFKEQVDGKQAITHYKILGIYKHHLLVEFSPITGRKHQIRKHSQLHDIPICGDRIYFPETDHQKLHLHAYTISNQTNTPLIQSFLYQASFPVHMKKFEQFFL